MFQPGPPCGAVIAVGLPLARSAAMVWFDTVFRRHSGALAGRPAGRYARPQAAGLAAGCTALLLSGCSSLLIYYPSDKYDNKIVRGVVTHIATKEEMGRNWDLKARQLPDAPSRAEYISDYSRVVVVVDRSIGSASFVHPFVPTSLVVGIGDVVDVPVDVYSATSGTFSGRLTISRIVCKAADHSCLESAAGRVRGPVNDMIRPPLTIQ